jgi:hypothetical protein
MHTDHHHGPTIVLEAVASKDPWIWHCFFTFPNQPTTSQHQLLQRSHLFSKIAIGDALSCNYTVNGHDYVGIIP